MTCRPGYAAALYSQYFNGSVGQNLERCLFKYELTKQKKHIKINLWRTVDPDAPTTTKAGFTSVVLKKTV